MTSMISAFSTFYLFLLVWYDLKYRRIPNVITFPTLLAGIILHLFNSGPASSFSGIYGACIGFFIMLIPFLMSGMGAGDVKGFAALGALIGPSAIFQTFLYTAIIGGAFSLIYILIACNIREKVRTGIMAFGTFAATRDPRCFAPGPPKKKHKIPYAPAMLLGYVAYLAWGNLV